MSIPEPEDIGRWMARFNHAAKLFGEKYEDQGFNDLVFMVVCGATLEAILGVGLTAHKAGIDLSTYYLHNCIEAAISRKVVSREFEPALLAFKDIRNA